MSKPKSVQGLDRIARLLDLVPYISAHQGISLSELAQAFSTTQSHITEDLNTLWMCGLPGYTPLELMELSFESGFVTIRNAQTLEKPRSLSRDEILALILGLENLKDQVVDQGSKVGSEIGTLLSKLSALVGSSMHERVTTNMPALAAIRSQLAQAVANRRPLEITYHSLVRDKVTTRDILPLDLFIDNDVEYVLAFCELSGAHRTFRVDRILSARQTQPHAAPPDSLHDFSTNKVKIGIQILTRARDALESLGLEPKDKSESLDVVVEAFNTEWATRIVMSMGGAVRVTSPAQCVDDVAKRASKTLIGYGIASK